MTTGWKDDSSAPLAAATLHASAIRAGGDYTAALVDALKTASTGTPILGLDELFRRHTAGFQPIKTFIGAMVDIQSPANIPQPPLCHIDVFAYVILKGAKNFDFLLPLDCHANVVFQRTRGAWSNALTALENFERLGEPLPGSIGASVNQYLALRNIVSRASARDERRVLATLLVSGPSTLEQILKELGLNYSLGQRILSTFEDMSVVERRTVTRSDAPVFAVSESALPLSVFCLRETIGLDLSSTLPTET